MVLYVVRPNEEDVEGLRRLQNIGAAYLRSRYWLLVFTARVRFEPPIPLKPEELVIGGIEFAASAAKAMQYLYCTGFPEPPPFSLETKAWRKRYYKYYSWCRMIFHEPANDYEHLKIIHETRELSLEPPRSLYTVVPTQMSSLV